MMEDALRRGIAGRRPDHARLQPAYAYHLAGRTRSSADFRTVQARMAPPPWRARGPNPPGPRFVKLTSRSLAHSGAPRRFAGADGRARFAR